jgi:hypothetical protein
MYMILIIEYRIIWSVSIEQTISSNQRGATSGGNRQKTRAALAVGFDPSHPRNEKGTAPEWRRWTG